MLLHGGLGSSRHWQTNITALAHHFEVLAIDLPGFGDADDVEALDGEPYVKRAVAALATAVPARRFGLAAFSFGSVIATALARESPDRVAHLSLLAPAGFGAVPNGRAISLLPLPPRDTDLAGFRAAVAHNLGVTMLARAPDPNDPVVDLQIANIAQARFDSRKVSLLDRLPRDLAGTCCPVQVIWGERDALVHPSVTGRIELCRAARPDATVIEIPDAGHWVQREASTQAESLLIRFHSGRGLLDGPGR
ncbi:MAG: alpha/beta fold hydrolase [Rhodoplanes sp.]|uniref:alpha/beta fold hydrolase n=1 Tax=Rhodoplanes sp. TaxID=1968906 RepID=UPI0017EF2805|nr:alpha/beta fold hydrolase [Rhodoplanes sp.]NVO17888.1 alpha/beta fold hydrolase [Rhodoplanes sp.]